MKGEGVKKKYKENEKEALVLREGNLGDRKLLKRRNKKNAIEAKRKTKNSSRGLLSLNGPDKKENQRVSN